MSKIAGIFSQESSAVETMLAASRESHDLFSHLEKGRSATLGICGRQPFIACSDTVHIVMDGSIYDGPAGSLADLYARHGFKEMLRLLNGDFAIALYDPAIDTLWLARDRFGVKPLFYAQLGERFAFASRMRALLALPDVSRDINRGYAARFAGMHYRVFDNAPEETPFAAIRQLPAAHCLKITQAGIETSCYWRLEETPDFTESEETLAASYRDLLIDAVRLRLQAARKPAFTLSGGMDSSSVLACAVRSTGQKQHAFSTVYEDATYDESNEIESMLGETVSEWHRVTIGNPDVFNLVEHMVAVHDEPVATATWLSHYLLCRDAKQKGFSSLFGGLGGDELNAGEYEHFFFFFADLLASGQSEILRRETQGWMTHHDHPIFRKSEAVRDDALRRLVDLSRPGICLPDMERLGRYQSAVNRDYHDLNHFTPVMDHPFRSYLKNRTYQDLMRETIPCCLRAENRQTEVFGLDGFLPFFDHRLAEFMFRVPGTMKFQDGVGKRLLRAAMRGVLPEETRTRIKKTGWNAPAHVWFSGARREPLLDLVHSARFRQRGIYNLDKVMAIIEEHESIVASGEARDNHMMFLWQLVNLELWFRSTEP